MSGFSVVSQYMQSIMLVLLPIAGMMLVFYSAYQLYNDLSRADKKKIRERLKEEQGRAKAKKTETSILRRHDQKKLYEQVLERVKATRKLQTWLNQAGLDMSGPKLLLGLMLGAAVAVSLGLLLNLSVWITFGIPIAILVIPIFVFKTMAAMRMKKLVRQLPDVFQLISQSLRAGHALPSGIQLVGTQLPDPAGTEFARVFHEQNLGIKIEDSLKSFADRADQLDVRFFVTAVLIQRQTGGDLAEVLDKIGAVIRERIQIMGQVKALTAEGRMSGWVLSALPPFVFLMSWMLNPDYAGVLLYEKQGNYLLIGGGISQIIGMLMIKKIVNIKI